MKFNLDQVRQLIAVVSECSSMQDQGSRDSIIDDLRQEIRQKIKFYPARGIHIKNVVNTCLEYSDSGGLEELLQSLFILEGSTDAMREVWEKLVEIYQFGSLLQPKYYVNLIPIILNARISNTEIRELYAHSCPTNFHGKYGGGALLATLSDISKIPSERFGEPPPLCIFINALSKYLKNEEDQDHLGRWFGEAFPKFSQETFIKVNKKSHKSLLITIDPYANNQNNPKQKYFFVSIYLWREEEKSPACWHQDVKPRLLNSVPDLLSNVMANHAEEPDILEFFLPFDLFDHQVERWTYSSVYLSSELGIEFPIVIRSLDRIMDYNLQLYARWIGKWESLQKYHKKAVDEIVMWVGDRDIYDQSSLYYRLKQADKPCLGLTQISPNNPIGLNYFKPLLQAALPVAMWLHSCKELGSEKIDLQQEMTKLIECEGMARFPNVLHRARLEAGISNNELHLGKFMVLLWDDPNKLPPSPLLRIKIEQFEKHLLGRETARI